MYSLRDVQRAVLDALLSVVCQRLASSIFKGSPLGLAERCRLVMCMLYASSVLLAARLFLVDPSYSFLHANHYRLLANITTTGELLLALGRHRHAGNSAGRRCRARRRIERDELTLPT